MGIHVQLIVTLYIVNFVMSGQQDNQVVYQFQNPLFGFIGNNIEKKSETYYENLKQEIVKKQNAFDAIKEELLIAQIQNMKKKRNFFETSKDYKNIIAIKRETNENGHTEMTLLTQSSELPQSASVNSTDKLPHSSGQSTEPTKPTSPKPPDQTCIDLKSAIWSYDMKSFVKVVNSVYKKLYPHPQTNLGSLGVLNHILVSCHTHTKLAEVIRRPDPKSNYTQAAGTLDIRTVDQKGGNLVIKLKFNRESCISLSQLLKCADEKSFKELYPGEKVTLLSLSFNKDFEGPVIFEWIALYVKDGEIVGKGEQHKAKCLKTKEFNDLKYKEKPIVEYFENLD